jgi:hypothetical protein
VTISLTTFSGQNPPWQLAQLDANFLALQNAVNGLVTTGQFTGICTSANTGNVIFNYTTVGPIVWISLSADQTTPQAAGGFIIITGMPPQIVPNTGQIVTGGVMQNNGSECYAGVLIQSNAFIVIGALNNVSGVGLTRTGFTANTSHGFMPGFSFSYLQVV